jgi:hypothetical protein
VPVSVVQYGSECRTCRDAFSCHCTSAALPGGMSPTVARNALRTHTGGQGKQSQQQPPCQLTMVGARRQARKRGGCTKRILAKTIEARHRQSRQRILGGWGLVAGPAPQRQGVEATGVQE